MRGHRGPGPAPARPVVYWDSCMYIHWLSGNPPADPAEDAGLREQIRRFRMKEIILCASVVTSVEVLASSLPEERAREFRRLREMRDDFAHVAVDPGIADLAHEIRDYYQALKSTNDGKTLSTPDAIHLATAINERVDVMYTFDRKQKRFLGLVPLSGHVARTYPLKIERPAPPDLLRATATKHAPAATLFAPTSEEDETAEGV
jgi:predicted nucleic acid-binding protein